jgi:hypothetical protein
LNSKKAKADIPKASKSLKRFFRHVSLPCIL